MAFAACHKSSSSSSSGSVPAAVSQLTSLGFANSGAPLSVQSVRPHTTPTCLKITGGPMTSGGTASCPSGEALNSMYLSSPYTMTFTSCTSGGYTISGVMDFNISSNSPVYTCMTNSTLNSMGGTFTFGTPSGQHISFTGNNLQGQTNCTIDLTATMSESNGAYSGTITGTACSQNINSSF